MQRPGVKTEENFNLDAVGESAFFQYIIESNYISLTDDGGNILPSAFKTTMDKGISIPQNQLPQCHRNYYDNLISKIKTYASLNVSNISLQNVFIVKYCNQHNNSAHRIYKGLAKHHDYIDDDTNIFTCVYTKLSSDCYGSNVMYSARDDGIIDKCNRNTICFTPKDKELYSFIGSYIQHCVSGISSGNRVACVFWFKWNVDNVDVVKYVNGKEFVCDKCFHSYVNDKILRHHKCNKIFKLIK